MNRNNNKKNIELKPHSTIIHTNIFLLRNLICQKISFSNLMIHLNIKKKQMGKYYSKVLYTEEDKKKLNSRIKMTVLLSFYFYFCILNIAIGQVRINIHFVYSSDELLRIYTCTSIYVPTITTSHVITRNFFTASC